MAAEPQNPSYRSISEAATYLGLPAHVLRFWESRFPLRPMTRAGGRRYYRTEDLEFLAAIRHYLYEKGYSIKGVQRLIKERGVEFITQRQHLPEQTKLPSGAGREFVSELIHELEEMMNSLNLSAQNNLGRDNHHYEEQ